MAAIKELQEMDLQNPYLIEGLPGVGLVGKIATDHISEELGFEEYAEVRCQGLPEVAVFESNEHQVRTPVRIMASEEENIMILGSDVPISPVQSPGFAECVLGWIMENNVYPVFLSGLPTQKKEKNEPKIYGVSTNDADERLRNIDISPPSQSGQVSGPTGALISNAAKNGVESIGLIVETDPRFPDPLAAKTLIEKGISPITGIDVSLKNLEEHEENIREQKNQLAQQLRETQNQESTSATPLGMYQ